MKIWQMIVQTQSIWFAKGKQLPGYGIRQSSWAELFFDLMFVVGISTLNFRSFFGSNSLNFINASYLIFSFLSLWQIWMSVTFYSNQFETNSVRHRLLLFLNITSVAMLVLGIDDRPIFSFTTQGNFYLIAFIFSRLILKLTWFNVQTDWCVAPIRELIHKLQKVYSLMVSIKALLWLFLVFFGGKVNIGIPLWGLTLLFEFVAVNYLLAKSQHDITSFHHVHLKERFGLFTIMLLGELTLNALTGLRALENFTVTGILTAFVLMFFIFLFWWVYYDQVMTFPFRETGRSRIVWTASHFFFALINLLLASVMYVIASQHQLNHAIFYALIGLLIAFFAVLTLMHLSLDMDAIEQPMQSESKIIRSLKFYNLVYVRLFSIVLLLGLAFVPSISTLWLLVLLCLILALNVACGLLIWIAQRHCLSFNEAN
ncbi:MAG: low temperature requirement protein A [Erysipelotrichaceae bacterium]